MLSAGRRTGGVETAGFAEFAGLSGVLRSSLLWQDVQLAQWGQSQGKPLGQRAIHDV